MPASPQERGKEAVPDAKAAEVVRKLELQWMEAYAKRDIAFLEKVLSDDYTSAYPNGSVPHKKGEIEAVKSGAVASTEMKPVEIKAPIYGNLAVFTGRSTIKAKVNGQDVRGDYGPVAAQILFCRVSIPISAVRPDQGNWNWHRSNETDANRRPPCDFFRSTGTSKRAFPQRRTK